MKQIPKWLSELILIVAAVLFIRAFFVQAFNIPSASMQPTLLIGDFILVNKLVYRFTEPRVGDIIVFRYPVNPSLDYIKRIVAGPGDLVEFETFRDPETNLRVYKLKVNGKEFPLKYVQSVDFNGKRFYEFVEKMEVKGKEIEHKVWYSGFSTRFAGLVSYTEDLCLEKRFNLCVKFYVPEDSYFVMGDNRDNSEDSRFWGFVPKRNIVGKAFVVYFSGEVPPLTPEDVTIFTGFRQLLIALLNPRFERIGKFFIY